jgi:ubiquinol-cytochrome c reductase cytochrome c1 subunit
MKKLISILMLAALPAVGFASSEGVALDHVKVDLSNRDSLQRGARIFVNYCLSCHSASYMRYNRMGHDLGISDELVKENLLFAADKVGDLMKAVMPRDDAKIWFGAAPPDLSLVARSRGPEWFYTYMRSFYRDPKSPTGWNNRVLQNVSMPHVLFEWQGEQRAVFETVKDEHGGEHEVAKGFEIQNAGTMTREEYDRAMRDLTNFMVYLGEPAKLVRKGIGVWTILFLIVFTIVAYLMKKEYWKDVH